MWTYCDTSIRNEGTTFHCDNAERYFTWIWEIPISPNRLSVGAVWAADWVKAQRERGKSVPAILYDEIAKHPRLAPLFAERPDGTIHTCSYRSYVYRVMCGPNWLMVGEAAALPDPLTANGFTAALRHAQDAAYLINACRHRTAFSSGQQDVYNANVRRMGDAFNQSIERLVYEWPVRWGLGLRSSVDVYTTFSYPINALYSKFQPRSRLAVALFGCLFLVVQLWIATWSLLGLLAIRWRHFQQQTKRRISRDHAPSASHEV
jgi:hypothetical protein